MDKRAVSDGLSRGDQDSQRSGARIDLVGGNTGQNIAREAHLFGREEALPPRVVGELPGLFSDPGNHRGEDEIELAALPRARFVVQAADVALKQRIEQLFAEGDHVFVPGKRAFFPVGIFLDALVRADDLSELEVFSPVACRRRARSRITDVTRAPP